MGRTDEVLALGDVAAKYRAFGFDALEVDGHDEAALAAAITELKARPGGAPKALVARTVKGRGVSFMENNNLWHYTRLNADTYAAARAELGGAP